MQFQSTLPRRERQPSGKLFLFTFRVSIHAPTKGATMYSPVFFPGHLFQSTLPRRERLDIPRDIFPIPVFQSTLPRRERPHKPRAFLSPTPSFNPRSHEGSDRRCQFFDEVQEESFNPRSHEGSDSSIASSKVLVPVFQSTLPRRERPLDTEKTLPFPPSFNPRSHEGSDCTRLSRCH